MPFRAPPPSLNPVEQPPVPSDSLVQFLIFALLNQVCESH